MTLITTDVAAVALGVEPATVRQLIRRGLLKRYGTRKRALVDLAECEARKERQISGGGYAGSQDSRARARQLGVRVA